MKKLIWLVILIAIAAVVLISVFAVQRDSLSTQVSKLQSENADLNQRISDVDMTVKTTQELAETMVREANEKLTQVTAQRDELQSSADAATAQLNDGIRQVKAALASLGVEDSEAKMAAELEETKKALQNVTVERDALIAAVSNAAVDRVAAVVTNEAGETVAEAEDVQALSLADLPAGAYTVTVVVSTVGGQEAGRYAFPYVSEKAEEVPEETQAEQAPAEEAAPAPEATAELEPPQPVPQEETVPETPAEQPDQEAEQQDAA